MIQVMPPGDGSNNPIRANNRLYACAPGNVLQVPNFDADVLEANGWVKVAYGAGTSALRPANPVKGQEFHDTTLGRNIRFDGRLWRDPANGIAV